MSGILIPILRKSRNIVPDLVDRNSIATLVFPVSQNLAKVCWLPPIMAISFVSIVRKTGSVGKIPTCIARDSSAIKTVV